MNFWHNKKVLITGHTGFKGSWLSLWLQTMGAEVIGCSLEPPSNPNLFSLANVAKHMVAITGDIRDVSSLHKLMAEHKPQIVFHLAAQALVRPSYLNPVETYETNVMGTVNVLEAIRSCDSVRSVVIVTSDKCYENREWLWGYRENDPMGGHDPYSSSKGCAELITAAYRSSFFHSSDSAAVATVRAGNVIGGGDWSVDRLIPDIMRSVADASTVTIRNPGATRPWQHVMDPLHGYLLLAEKLYLHGNAFAEGWNFGPSEGGVQSVGWIADTLSQYWGEGLQCEFGKESQLHEAQLLKLDSSKAMSRLDWSPLWDIEMSLQLVVDWYQAYYAQADLRKITEKQIGTYVNS